MSNNVPNEMIFELLKGLKEDVEKARMERHQILDELRAVKDQVSALKSDLGRGSQKKTSLAQKVAALDN